PPPAPARRPSRPEPRLATRAVGLPQGAHPGGILGPLHPGADGGGEALGAQATVDGGRLPIVLRGDGLLRAAPDVLPPERLLSRCRRLDATGGSRGRLLRVRLRGRARDGVAPLAVPALALHAGGSSDADARVRPLAIPAVPERRARGARPRRGPAADAHLRRDHLPRRARARDQPARGRAPPRRSPQARR